MTQFPENVETKFGDLLVEVIDWVDHHGGDQGYQTKARIDRDNVYPTVLRTVGMFLSEDEESVTLAMEQRGDYDLDDPLFRFTATLMKRLIIRRVRLEAPA